MKNTKCLIKQRRCHAIGLLAASSLALNNCAGAASIYYNVDFGSPPHTVGLPPVYSTASNTPSTNYGGSPSVASSVGMLADQALLLNTLGNSPSFYYDGILFNMGFGQSTYHLSFDIITQNLIGSTNQMVVLLDMPTVSRFVLTNSGTITPGAFTGPGGALKFATYQDDQPYHVDISVDIPANRRVVLLDGVVISDGAITGGSTAPNDVHAIRFQLGLITAGTPVDHTTNVGIDNILITNTFLVPEPSSPVLLILGLSTALVRRLRV